MWLDFKWKKKLEIGTFLGKTSCYHKEAGSEQGI